MKASILKVFGGILGVLGILVGIWTLVFPMHGDWMDRLSSLWFILFGVLCMRYSIKSNSPPADLNN